MIIENTHRMSVMAGAVMFMVLGCSTLAPAAGIDISDFATVQGCPQIQWSQETNQLGVLLRRASLATGAWEWACGIWPASTQTVFRDIWHGNETMIFYTLAATNAAPAGARMVTYVDVPGQGPAAVMIHTPGQPRYAADSAPVVVHINTFLTHPGGLNNTPDFTRIGLIHSRTTMPPQRPRTGWTSANGAIPMHPGTLHYADTGSAPADGATANPTGGDAGCRRRSDPAGRRRRGARNARTDPDGCRDKSPADRQRVDPLSVRGPGR